MELFDVPGEGDATGSLIPEVRVLPDRCFPVSSPVKKLKRVLL